MNMPNATLLRSLVPPCDRLIIELKTVCSRTRSLSGKESFTELNDVPWDCQSGCACHESQPETEFREYLRKSN